MEDVVSTLVGPPDSYLTGDALSGNILEQVKGLVENPIVLGSVVPDPNAGIFQDGQLKTILTDPFGNYLSREQLK